MSVGVAVLGSTGSIGCSTLAVLARHPDRFRVVALTAHSNAELLRAQADRWRPVYLGMVNGGDATGAARHGSV
jgi:1-deoxy-D-xylulose-5-phosphate reductoisomerase